MHHSVRARGAAPPAVGGRCPAEALLGRELVCRRRERRADALARRGGLGGPIGATSVIRPRVSALGGSSGGGRRRGERSAWQMSPPSPAWARARSGEQRTDGCRGARGRDGFGRSCRSAPRNRGRRRAAARRGQRRSSRSGSTCRRMVRGVRSVVKMWQEEMGSRARAGRGGVRRESRARRATGRRATRKRASRSPSDDPPRRSARRRRGLPRWQYVERFLAYIVSSRPFQGSNRPASGGNHIWFTGS